MTDDDLRRRIAELIPLALAVAKPRGPEALVRTGIGVLGRSRPGWCLARWDVVLDGAPRTLECYLLDNGRLSVGAAPPDPTARERRHDAGELKVDSRRADAVLTRADDLLAGLERLISAR